jgi:hypothetical protein
MQIAIVESDRKSCDDNFQFHHESNDRAVHLIAERFALSRDHASEVARLAGLGEQEARR